LDPHLGFYKGKQYLPEEKNNFGIFLDSSPDRWGRLLMRRREAWQAKEERRDERTLFESDFLLGVFDGHRMGGVRFKLSEDGSIAYRIDISLGRQNPDYYEVLTGLKAGDKIITSSYDNYLTTQELILKASK
jgi:hypothetical protein